MLKLWMTGVLSAVLGVYPALAGNAPNNETANKEVASQPAMPAASNGVGESSASRGRAAEEPSPASYGAEIEQLREMVTEQARQLETQQQLLREQEQKLSALTEELRAARSANEHLAAPASSGLASLAAGANSEMSGNAPAPVALATSASSPQQGPPGEESPLRFRIGTADITPVGFMDFTGVWRSRDGGSGIGTNFAGIPYGGSTSIPTNLGEFRESMQNSRIGFRVDADVKGAHVIGYMETDFLGNNPGNVAVSSNSNTLRSRLYWVDLRESHWEVLGGQTWSLITPNRSGISPLPADVFFSQDMDVNYQLGLVWGRIPELRVVYHPSDKMAFAIALDSPEQYIGGSAGAPTPTLPAALATYTTELNNGGNTFGVPNRAPDVIAKLAFDPSKKVHAEIGGVARFFQAYNPTSATHYSATGGGGFVNVNFELFKGFRLLTNNFWSDGGGRYIFGQAPDLIVRADGSLSLIHSGSTVSGVEYTHRNTMIFGYYGGLYVQRNVAFDANGTTLIGYGFSGSSSSQNRAVQEGTLGFNQAFWKNAKYGALNLIGQYSYLSRNPWFVATGAPKDAHLDMVFLDLRYTLPGSAPTLGK